MHKKKGKTQIVILQKQFTKSNTNTWDEQSKKLFRI